MAKMNQSQFKDKLEWSQRDNIKDAIEKVFRHVFADYNGFSIAPEQLDRQGVDFIVERSQRPSAYVDGKIRELDPLEKWGHDDVALESYSVVEDQIIGWTLDMNKQTEYVLWLWPSRWLILDYKQLRHVAVELMATWKIRFKVAQQETTKDGRTYHSECVFVPIIEITKAIDMMFDIVRINRGQFNQRIPII